jgi:hypothetical protein
MAVGSPPKDKGAIWHEAVVHSRIDEIVKSRTAFLIMSFSNHLFGITKPSG